MSKRNLPNFINVVRTDEFIKICSTLNTSTLIDLDLDSVDWGSRDWVFNISLVLLPAAGRFI